MREIKLRAWDKRCNKMVYPNKENPSWVILKHKEMFNILKLIQFTGLKDKNGEDIYEGDIVRFSINMGISYNHYNGAVVFHNGAFRFDNFKYIKGHNRYGLGRQYHDFPIGYYGNTALEIIGNIYENPELIKQEKVDK